MMRAGIAVPTDFIYETLSTFARKRYATRLGATIPALPDAFSYVTHHEELVGCFGMYRADRHEQLLLERYIPGAFERIACKPHVERIECAELGTRAVVPPVGASGREISLILAASLILYASSVGIRYVGFTGNRTLPSLARSLGIDLTVLGDADVSGFDRAFRENWSAFFRGKQHCYGFEITSITSYREVLAQIER